MAKEKGAGKKADEEEGGGGGFGDGGDVTIPVHAVGAVLDENVTGGVVGDVGAIAGTGVEAEGIASRGIEGADDVAEEVELNAAAVAVGDEDVAKVVDGKAEAGGVVFEAGRQLEGETEWVAGIIDIEGLDALVAPVEDVEEPIGAGGEGHFGEVVELAAPVPVEPTKKVAV